MTTEFAEDCNEIEDIKHANKSHKKMLMCDHCSERYRHKRDLDIHVQTFHKYVNEKKKHVCHQCSERYIHKRDLDKHVKRMHRETYNCDQCEKTYFSAGGLRHHKLTNHCIRGTYKCDQCDKTYYTKEGLQKHTKMTKHPRPSKSYPCHLCSKTCKSQTALEYHLQSFHYAKEINQLFKCDHCSFTSFYRPQLRDHTQIHNK